MEIVLMGVYVDLKQILESMKPSLDECTLKDPQNRSEPLNCKPNTMAGQLRRTHQHLLNFQSMENDDDDDDDDQGISREPVDFHVTMSILNPTPFGIHLGRVEAALFDYSTSSVLPLANLTIASLDLPFTERSNERRINLTAYGSVDIRRASPLAMAYLRGERACVSIRGTHVHLLGYDDAESGENGVRYGRRSMSWFEELLVDVELPVCLKAK
jgi:hypothetical protein